MAWTRKTIWFWVSISLFLLFFGGTINPMMFNEQLQRRIATPTLLEPHNTGLNEFDIHSENVHRLITRRTKMAENVTDPQFYEIQLVEDFVLSYVKYKSDFFQYLAIDHLSTTAEVLSSRMDDCDGRAILAASLLLNRGYNAWVIVSWTHWWVEIILEDGFTLQILTQGCKTTWLWYMKFNDTEMSVRGFYMLGFIFYNFFLASLVPILLPRFQGRLPRDPTLNFFLRALLLLGLIPFGWLLVFYVFGS